MRTLDFCQLLRMERAPIPLLLAISNTAQSLMLLAAFTAARMPPLRPQLGVFHRFDVSFLGRVLKPI